MERRIAEEHMTKDFAMGTSLPPPRQIMNQSAEYQVIEKAAQLLKKVEQHWKKSLFHNRLQFSPVSESLNSSESENYIEKLAAIKFKDASFKRQSFCGTDAMHPNVAISNRENRMDQNLLMSYDVVSNYFDIIGSRRMNTNDNGKKVEENCGPKCPRCLAKEGSQRKSVSVLPKQQYVLKQNLYGQRSRIRHGRGGGGSSLQISPRSNDSHQTPRTYAGAFSPRAKSNLVSSRARMSTSNPDLRSIIMKECSQAQRHHYSPRCCGIDASENFRVNTSNKSEAGVNTEFPIMSNVSVVNVKSNNQTTSIIPEVNPRKLSTAPDKMIIIQHLPQVDIKPELSKQSGPVISIEAERNEEIKESKNNNIGVFNYIHKSKPKFQSRELKTFSTYNRYRNLLDNPTCTEEESFAAQLELRSVAENFIFRLKKNDNPSSYILSGTILRLMDEVNEMIDSNLSGSGVIPSDPNLPPRMEMVSDLLSDELKTWGAQHPSHYLSLNNIIQHLILDIQFAKNGNQSSKALEQNVNPSSSIDKNKIFMKSSILKSGRTETSGEHSGRQKHVLLTGDQNYEPERSEVTYRSARSEELSLSDKLLQQNALKVQRLEKAYKINHKARVLKRKKEEKDLEESMVRENFNETNHNNISDEFVDKENISEDFPDYSKGVESASSNEDDSHPVVAIITSSQNGSIEEDHEKTISEGSSDEENKSVAEDIVEEKEESDSIPEEPEDQDTSKLATEHHSEENVVEKDVSEAEDEVQEVLSDHSQAVTEKHKDSGGSEYDEDFEADVTEQPSHSATATSSNQNENTGKSSCSHQFGTDEVLVKDRMMFTDHAPILSKSVRSDKVFIDKNTVSLPNIEIPSEESVIGAKMKDIRKVRKVNGLDTFEGEISETVHSSRSVGRFHSRPIEDSHERKPSIKKIDKSTDMKKSYPEDSDNKENNFVKVHVRDDDGEIILSYAGSKINPDHRAGSTESKNSLRNHTDNAKENVLKPTSSMDNYIETERKVLENLTSNILKELLDDKIQNILSKFSKEDLKSGSLNHERPSSSKAIYSTIKQQSTQTSPEKIKKSATQTEKENLIKDKNDGGDDDDDDDEYLLKSPKFKLKIDTTLKRSENIVTEEPLEPNKKEAENEDLTISDQDERILDDEIKGTVLEENRCSPDVKLLIGLVSDLDSSDIEYCEASLKQLSNEELGRNKTEVNNKNLRLHHFNSDEFLVYPRLNPQPSDVKILQYSGDEPEMRTDIATSYESQQSQVIDVIKNDKLVSSQSIAVRSVAIECDLKLYERIEPLPETPLTLTKTSTSSTQTDKALSSKPYTIRTPSLVDLIEISCSQSSSSSDSNHEKLKTVQKDQLITSRIDQLNNLLQDRLKVETEKSLAKPAVEILPDFATIEELPEQSVTTDQSSIIPSEINPHNLFNKTTDVCDLPGETSDCDPHDDVSSATDNTVHSSPTESLESQSRIHGSMLRVLEASTARPAAWSSSTDSTTDDERFLILNQPPSDDDDVLGDLEQLMDYLKNSKSSTSYGKETTLCLMNFIV